MVVVTRQFLDSLADEQQRRAEDLERREKFVTLCEGIQRERDQLRRDLRSQFVFLEEAVHVCRELRAWGSGRVLEKTDDNVKLGAIIDSAANITMTFGREYRG
jgi:hypothetical protein